MMIAGAAAFALVAARMTLGRGAAVFAALFAILIRGIVAVVVGPVLGEPHNVFPLYLGAAVVVELLALTPLLQRRLAFGLVGGLAVATVGLWIESWWIDAAYLYPWPTSMWAEALAMAVPAGVVAGACGALLATVLSGEALARPAVRRGLVVALVLVIGAATASGVMVTVPEKASATVTLTDVAPQNGRMVTADVRIDPPTWPAKPRNGSRSSRGRAEPATAIPDADWWSTGWSAWGPGITAPPCRCRCTGPPRHCFGSRTGRR